MAGVSGSLGGSQSGSDSTSQSYISPYQRRKLRGLYDRAETLSNTPLEFYPGQTVADFDPATVDAQRLAEQRATAGSPLLAAAQEQNLASVRGDYLSPESNPHLRSSYDAAARAVGENFNRIALPGIESRFARAGQSQSGQLLGARQGATEALGRSLSDLATDIYGGAYESERGRQEAASRFAPDLAAEDYRDIDALSAVGTQREQQQQRLIDELIARFDFAQNEPNLRLSRYASLLGQPVVLNRSTSDAYSRGFDTSFGAQFGNLFGG